MHTHITKSNVAAAIRDDKAHMDYLKRDIKDDQKFHVADKDARQTADEQHITNLAQDVKHDEKKEGLSRKGSPARNMNHGEMKGKELHNHMMVHHPAKPPTSRHESDSQEIHNLDYINPVVKRGTKK
tara:strand:+ start:726 stop:1106 length:381 start_codon:yes stop_codon:yes gene_type:complete